MGLGLAPAIASGGHALGKIKSGTKATLYTLPWEDNERRLKSRLARIKAKVAAFRPTPSPCHGLSGPLQMGGMLALIEWLDRHPNPPCRH